MLLEAQDTGTIQNWLTQWIRSGLLVPKETVTDASRALETAILRNTGLLIIEKYCDLFSNDQMPPYYFRSDVVSMQHYLNMNTNLSNHFT